jgi:hypothetical protein
MSFWRRSCYLPGVAFCVDGGVWDTTIYPVKEWFEFEIDAPRCFSFREADDGIVIDDGSFVNAGCGR